MVYSCTESNDLGTECYFHHGWTREGGEINGLGVKKKLADF